MKINITLLPANETPESFAAKYISYCQERKDHAHTIGVPAPFPEYDCFRTFWENQIEGIEFDKRDLALRDVALANAAREQAEIRLQEDVAIYRRARDVNATPEVLEIAASLPPAVVDEVVRQDFDEAQGIHIALLAAEQDAAFPAKAEAAAAAKAASEAAAAAARPQPMTTVSG